MLFVEYVLGMLFFCWYLDDLEYGFCLACGMIAKSGIFLMVWKWVIVGFFKNSLALFNAYLGDCGVVCVFLFSGDLESRFCLVWRTIENLGFDGVFSFQKIYLCCFWWVNGWLWGICRISFLLYMLILWVIVGFFISFCSSMLVLARNLIKDCIYVVYYLGICVF